MSDFKDQVKELLVKHAYQFRFYEQSHRAKNTEEAAEKANINARLAAETELFLAKHY